METRFCRDCIHVERTPDGKMEIAPYCTRTGRINLVTGKTSYEQCSTERIDRVGSCGKDGKHFEPQHYADARIKQDKITPRWERSEHRGELDAERAIAGGVE